MTINQLRNLINPLTNGNNQFFIQIDLMNDNNGKAYYNGLINLNVQLNYGVYVISDANNQNVLYKGKGGTICKDGLFGNQNLNGRLKNARGGFTNSFEYFRDIMNRNSLQSLIFTVFYSNANNPPAYIESISLREYLNQNGNLPMFNREF
jgi:hypothetical protein